MAKTVYVNGRFVRDFEAKISVFDRGFLFADSVYEVITVFLGELVDCDNHLKRLEKSMKFLDLSMPMERETILNLLRELIIRNNLNNGMIYLQVSRGSSERSFLIDSNVKPSLVMFCQEIDLSSSSRLKRGLKIVTLPEARWKHRDIKTTQLLAASLAKTKACKMGYDDAWFEENGFVTEGTSSNAFIVVENKKIVTRNIGKEILPGVTRFSIMKAASSLDFEVEERPFSVIEAERATEAFITSATNFITSVVAINGKAVGNGKVGTITSLLQREYLKTVKRTAL